MLRSLYLCINRKGKALNSILKSFIICNYLLIETVNGKARFRGYSKIFIIEYFSGQEIFGTITHTKITHPMSCLFSKSF